MKLIFLFVGNDITMPDMFVQSALATGHECIHLTDSDSPALEGAQCIRIPREGEGIMLFRAKCYAAYNQPGIYLDADMLVRKDLSPVMGLEFDVGLTRRNYAIIDPSGANMAETMPYNGGFAAVKDPTFWPEVYARMQAMDADLQEWYGDQFALVQAAKGRNVLELPIRLYNRTVKQAGLDVSGASVLHFKGRGKEVMASYT